MNKKFRDQLTELIECIEGVLGETDTLISLHEPEFGEDERKLVLDCLETGWVSSVGKYVTKFEDEVAQRTGNHYGVATVNGTAALEIAMKVIGVSAGDEVLMPALTFVATANAAHQLGATPHFIDSSHDTLGVDPIALEKYLLTICKRGSDGVYNKFTGRRLSCIVPMHVFGHPVDMDSLNCVANEFNLPVVEDAAEALGSSYNGRLCGSLSKVAAISFNGNKIITTGGGGAIVTNDEQLAVKAKHLTTTAKIPHEYEFDHDQAGHNYRMPNINAALGVGQILKLEDRIKSKRNLAKRYQEKFSNFTHGLIFSEPARCKSNYWLNCLVLSSDTTLEQRDFLIRGTMASNYMVRPCWKPMHKLSFHKNSPRAPLPVAESFERRIINLPSSAMLVNKT